MPELTDEQMRLLEALEPFRIAASRNGYENGVEQGILRVYNGILHWSVREPGDDVEERHRRIKASEEVRRWMEARYPIIHETYPPKDFEKNPPTKE